MERPDPHLGAGPGYRGLVLIAVAILVLLAGTVAVVLVAGGPRDPQLEPGSPEAVIHEYLTAYDAGDLELAHTFFSARVREAWDLDAYRRSVDMRPVPGRDHGPSRRVLFDRTDVSGDDARVRLTVEEFYGDGLSGDTYRSTREVRMIREDGSWRIDQALVWLDTALTDLR